MTTLRSSHIPAAWLLARQTLISRAGMGLLIAMLCVDLFARSALPFGIATSRTSALELKLEVRLLLFGCLALLVLLRAHRWRAAIQGVGHADLACIVALSVAYVHCIGSFSFVVIDQLLGVSPAGLSWTQVVAAIWLATLSGILACSRLEPRSLGLLFLLLAWWVPILGLPAAATGAAIGQAISCAPWSADGFLPMLVPHLWAVGYVCLERAQR